MFPKFVSLVIFTLCHKIVSTSEILTSCKETLSFLYRDFDKVHKFISSPCVKELDFSWNRIKYLDKDAFEDVPNLERLNLSRNAIQPENLFSFASLPKLKTLILSIQEKPRFYEHENLFPRTIFIDNSYPSLEDLALNDVGAKKLSSKNLAKLMPNLTTLNLGFNIGLDIADLMKNFPPSLKKLDLESNNVSFINFTGHHKLEILNLHKNNFQSLYFTDDSTTCESNNQLCVGWMNGLEELKVSYCGIEKITFQKFSFNPVPNLKILYLTGNKLKTLGGLPKLLSLEFLQMGSNDFESIENLCFLRNLSTLKIYFNRNPIPLVFNEDIEKCFPNLREFDFSENRLKKIPTDFFSNLNKLKKLDLSYNELKKIPNVPKTVTFFNLKFNLIKDLEDFQSVHLDTLKTLNLRKNPLSLDAVELAKKYPEKIVI